MAIQTKPKNHLILDTIAEQIVRDLYTQTRYLHRDDAGMAHKYHEEIIFEKEIYHEDGDTEKYHFSMIWNCIVNAELEDLYDSLQDYSSEYVRDYVRDVYPDWRHCMD